MRLPASNKGILKLLIAIAEHGNDYYGNSLTPDEEMIIGAIIADIQNGLGEAHELLAKLNLKYNSHS